MSENVEVCHSGQNFFPVLVLDISQLHDLEIISLVLFVYFVSETLDESLFSLWV